LENSEIESAGIYLDIIRLVEWWHSNL